MNREEEVKALGQKLMQSHNLNRGFLAYKDMAEAAYDYFEPRITELTAAVNAHDAEVEKWEASVFRLEERLKEKDAELNRLATAITEYDSMVRNAIKTLDIITSQL